MQKLKKRIEEIKKKRPGYGAILDFYQKVKEAQDRTKASLKIDPIELKKEWKEILSKEGFSLIEKEDFPLDIEVSVKLFQTLCQIVKESTPHMAGQIKKIEEGIDNKGIDLRKLLKEGIKKQEIEQVARESDIVVLSFLIQCSTQPSIEAGVERLRSNLQPDMWLKGYCPVCGSLPFLSLFKEEVGKRYLLCSYCRYQWRIDRLFCPFCNNKEQGSLHYFHGEGEEIYRMDLCDQCHQYIKTIDLRQMGESDPLLEDLATLHLDILAVQKGYKRPVPNPWIT